MRNSNNFLINNLSENLFSFRISSFFAIDSKTMNETAYRSSHTSQVSRSELAKRSMIKTSPPKLLSSYIHYSPQLSRALSQSQKVRMTRKYDNNDSQDVLMPPDVYSRDPNFNKIPDVFETVTDSKYCSHFRYPGFHGNPKMRPSPIHIPPIREIITRYDFIPNEEEIKRWKRISKSIYKQEKSRKSANKAKNDFFRIDLIISPSPPL